MSEVKNPQGTVTRRGFLKATGGLLGAATVATAVPSSLSAFADADQGEVDSGEQIFHGVCRSNCMQSCRFNAHVREGSW